jgi:glycine hydroxymethyltransferase
MYNSQDYLLKDIDPEIYEQVISEEKRQEEHIELIASENYTSPAFMAGVNS